MTDLRSRCLRCSALIPVSLVIFAMLEHGGHRQFFDGVSIMNWAQHLLDPTQGWIPFCCLLLARFVTGYLDGGMYAIESWLYFAVTPREDKMTAEMFLSAS